MKAPLEGDRISGAALLPDFLAPRDRKFFLTPRWRVRVFMGEQLLFTHSWISAPTAEEAEAYVRASGHTDGLRYEVTRVEEG